MRAIARADGTLRGRVKAQSSMPTTRGAVAGNAE
jgi:hypothetical protein